jgi:hypothetical protein
MAAGIVRTKLQQQRRLNTYNFGVRLDFDYAIGLEHQKPAQLSRHEFSDLSRQNYNVQAACLWTICGGGISQKGITASLVLAGFSQL